MNFIPAELRNLPQWVAWKMETRDGKETKVPYSPVTEGKASSTDPATWGTFAAALAYAKRAGMNGIGFVFKEGGGYVGIDLDHVRDPETGEIEPWALDIVTLLGSYTEVSQSGTGLHIICKGALPPGKRRKGAIEVYEQGRYFVMTGHHLEGTPLGVQERQKEIDSVHADYLADDPPSVTSQEKRVQCPTLMLDDEQILTLARNARNGAKLERLWAGDLSDYGGDHSRADAALCAFLAFYTRDPAQLDRLFRSSGLMRAKWDETHYSDGSTYGAGTIKSALEKVTTQYNPAHNGNGHALEEPDWMNEVPSLLGDEAALSVDPLPEGQNEIPPMGEPRAATLEIISADDLLTTEWPEPEWVVPGLFPVGLTLLAGRPKVGKSWLALQLAQAVTTGGKFLGQRVKQGRVLYLALEDSRRRIAARMSLQGWATGGGVCDFVTIGGLQKVGFLNKGGAAVLAGTIRAKQYRLVIVDTLSRAISGDQNDSREMTRAIAPLQVLAHEMGIGLVVLDHHNKLGAANPHSGGGSEGETPIDPVVNILGSTAKAALADCVMGLYKTPDKKGAVLAITGRDVEERAIALQFDKQTRRWQGNGNPTEAALTETRRKVLDVIRQHPNGIGCSALAEILGRNRGTVRRDLQHLCTHFLVERQDDTYYPLFEEKEEIGNHSNPGNRSNQGNGGNGRGVASVACVAGVARHGNATPAPVAVAEFDPGDELPEIDDDELPF